MQNILMPKWKQYYSVRKLKFLVSHQSIKIYNRQISNKNTVKYLGVYLDPKLTSKMYINTVLRKT